MEKVGNNQTAPIHKYPKPHSVRLTFQQQKPPPPENEYISKEQKRKYATHPTLGRNIDVRF